MYKMIECACGMNTCRIIKMMKIEFIIGRSLLRHPFNSAAAINNEITNLISYQSKSDRQSGEYNLRTDE